MIEDSIYIWVVIVLTFLAIVLSVLSLGRAIERRAIIMKRLESSIGSETSSPAALIKHVAERIDLNALTEYLSKSQRTKIRMDMVRAGYFYRYAPELFIAFTVVSILVSAAIGFFILEAFVPHWPANSQILLLITCSYAGYLIPDMFLRWRTRAVKAAYVRIFPDFLDLLVVCVDAGLALNAAFDRVTEEFYERSKPLALNFRVMLREIRAGRELFEAFDNLCDRIDVDEVRSFAVLIKQSMELGSDVSDALRVYSEEMRIKRLLRAEEEANKLPVKMLVPLGIFIFPVILIAIMTPVVIKAMALQK
ncbi:type II secretion system F family protein [Methylocystis echinoides]|uniref:TadC pilus assembly protein n=1 Tax=Methylocystis echinoides TaxID=29468 RepID=A0A9W6LT07_9HYPH|nr:type II secretion system F family protein [Methylocystis echinoides]GLI94027.1 TadC pilus assembly protein [Methylocystis echinoides]